MIRKIMNKILPYADSTVATIQHLFLNNKGFSDKVFAVTIRIVADYYGSEKDLPSVSGFVSLAVIPSGHRQVYASFTKRPHAFSDREWQLVCSHDSAWRDDGVRSTLKGAYDAVMREACAEFHKEERELTVHVAIENMTIDSPEKIFVPDRVNKTLSRPKFVFI
jgi:hypothetical protein